jgi:hypothetical protein
MYGISVCESRLTLSDHNAGEGVRENSRAGKVFGLSAVVPKECHFGQF